MIQVLGRKFVLISTDALNSFAKHQTSTGPPELARTLVRGAADLEFLSPELQICWVPRSIQESQVRILRRRRRR
jgi:hypothetical protein